MVRQKLTISLSEKCIELIDRYAETTGFESRSRVIEETVFAISELINYRYSSAHKFQQQVSPNPSAEELLRRLLALMDVIYSMTGVLDRFERFSSFQTTKTSAKPSSLPDEGNKR